MVRPNWSLVQVLGSRGKQPQHLPRLDRLVFGDPHFQNDAAGGRRQIDRHPTADKLNEPIPLRDFVADFNEPQAEAYVNFPEV